MISGRSQYTANYTASLFPLLDEESQEPRKDSTEKNNLCMHIHVFYDIYFTKSKAIQNVSHIPRRNVQPSDSQLSNVSSRTNKSIHVVCLMRILGCLQNLFCKYMKISHNPNIY